MVRLRFMEFEANPINGTNVCSDLVVHAAIYQFDSLEMLLIWLVIFSRIDAGQILPKGKEDTTHEVLHNSYAHEVTYKVDTRVEKSVNEINMAASSPQILVNISHSRVRVEPEIMDLPPRTIIHEFAHRTNVHAGSADVLENAAPLPYQHDILGEATRLSDIINHDETYRRTIDVPVDINHNYHVFKQPVNIKLRTGPRITYEENVHAEEPRPNIYVLSQPVNVNYIRNSVDVKENVDKENVEDASVRSPMDRESQPTKKPVHENTTKRTTQKPVNKKTTKTLTQKPTLKKTTRKPTEKTVPKTTKRTTKPLHEKTKKPAGKPVNKRTTKSPAQRPVDRKNIKVSHYTSIKVAKPVNSKVKLEKELKVKISKRVHAQGVVKSRIATSHKSASHKKHEKRPVQKPNKLPVPVKGNQLNIRIDEHTNIKLQPKSHIHLVSQTDDKPGRPVNVNINVNLARRRGPHMHSHGKPIESIYSEMRHTTTHRYTTRRRTTTRKVTPRSTTRRPASVGTVKLRYDEWLKFGGCHYMVKRDAKNFDDAEASCRRHGSHLVSIHSEAENNFIHKITSTGSGVKSFLEFVYIGLRENSKNEWEWIDGSPLNYKKWAPHQPDLQDEERCGQFHQEPAAHLYDVKDYHWNSIRCIRPMKYYVCKRCRSSARGGCCCSHCSCKDTCRNKSNEPHKPETQPAQSNAPKGDQAVFPTGANTVCPGHKYMSDTMRMHMRDTHNFRRSELALGRIKDHTGKKMPTAANMNLLIWDCKLEQDAYNHVRNCPSKSSGSSGENFYRGTITVHEPTYRDMNKKTVTEWWKVVRYQGGQNSFTMMGWGTSRRMGCVIATCGKDWVQSCRYDPPGNRGNQQYIPGPTCSKCGSLHCNAKLGLCT